MSGNQPAPTTTYAIVYDFEPLEKGQTARQYTLELEMPSITLKHRQGAHAPPEWTRLESNQCEGCPLKKETHPHCPVAVNMAETIETFADAVSFGRVRVKVTTKERTYIKDTALQEGLFSIFGIIMATSRCPVMDFLRPMARFHLPFASTEETIVRSAAFYLLRQYFMAKGRGSGDFEMEDLKSQYAKVQNVNEGILARIHAVIQKGDADQNALVILNVFAQMLGMELSDKLGGIEYLFKD